jgi:hypothetical protein
VVVVRCSTASPGAVQLAAVAVVTVAVVPLVLAAAVGTVGGGGC